VVPPRDVLRHDADDPYLVVAADKGTATFSDIANGISAEYGFWLGDAFASGGSAGYDHKKMGITARGAWESVKRHFREMGVDTQSQDFTVVGIGDMSGDVFGNGMLLSQHIKLVAAFDHRHIFIDPNPDPARSFRSASACSTCRAPRGTTTTSRSSRRAAASSRAREVHPVSPQARAVLGIGEAELTPAALMKAILKAPADLLYNGGIGTYVKASHQTNAEAGDRANDAIRVNGRTCAARWWARAATWASRSWGASSTRSRAGASAPTRSTTPPAWTAPTTRSTSRSSSGASSRTAR
jgi:glutamate dehydrogenase